MRRENEISRVILDAAIEVHSVLARPGLLEGVYEEAIAYELALRGLAVERQKAVPWIYKGQRLGSDLRLDLLVEGMVLVECKATTAYNDDCLQQGVRGTGAHLPPSAGPEARPGHQLR